MTADDDGLRGQAKRNREAEEHRAALDEIQKRREEAAVTEALRGELAFAHLIGQAPSLMAALQKLKGDGRA